LNPKQLIVQEMESLKDILIPGRYQLQHKPIGTELVDIGSYRYPYRTLMSIQHAYALAVNGALDYRFVPSEKQTKGVASLRRKLDDWVEAVALGKYLSRLENLDSEDTIDDTDTKFSTEDIRDLHRKLDELKELILKTSSQGNDALESVFRELRAGQEVVFNEIDELRELLPKLTKKSWQQLFGGKLLDLVARRVISLDTLKWVLQKMNKLGLGSYSPNLLDW